MHAPEQSPVVTPPRMDLRRLLGTPKFRCSLLQSAAEHWAEHQQAAPDLALPEKPIGGGAPAACAAYKAKTSVDVDIQHVASITALSVRAASGLLEAAGGSIEHAVALHFDGAAARPPAPASLPVCRVSDPWLDDDLEGLDDDDFYSDDDSVEAWEVDGVEPWEAERAAPSLWLSRPAEVAVQRAVEVNNLDVLRSLLAQRPAPSLRLRPPNLKELGDLASGHDWPLWTASLHCHVDCAAQLLAAGSPVELRGDDMTPLMTAAVCGSAHAATLVHLLLRHGASTERLNTSGATALQCAHLSRVPAERERLEQRYGQVYPASDAVLAVLSEAAGPARNKRPHVQGPGGDKRAKPG